ncbi:CDP-diacylglycerol--glycerol-3-phosphate 3-phosphatidyltransferase [Amphiplicatus metriothermophilus]|uniref:CDP-diacylglycerol--glycerol-3-phosphate 3-phosphatidyltransferase n=1 Tax=Amphiplicatus metriothermophilus TaxID=1519374 RepID=A0A239PX85_9PROT|nr:CDP-diacylglycerol--glycerol-3-phosphate 3-phosphatidyltransferase [Amphiplicatus metriothermophilus]MBB5520005.1 CDP-diacylglycerol--glycerol-3-phosphate 3-phosphatidyltransferase [Amphiplicatus metriothermophilus]SNT74904.1 cardiolipin synthase [Amphiplicatus metriothermophilus]
MATLLTIARILAVIPFAALFLANAPWNMKAAFVVFALAALTDLLDGYIARRRGEVSALGAALDPLADKLLIAAALFLLARNGVIREAGIVAALIILLREILVGGLREALAQHGKSLPVTALAKIKTAAQLVAVGFLLAAAPGGFAGPRLAPVADGFLWLAAALTLWTGADYVLRGARALGAGARPAAGSES